MLKIIFLQAKSIGDESGPYRAVECLGGLNTQLNECDTLDDLFVNSVRKFSNLKCLGYRELLREEDEKQPNGRVFKKVCVTGYVSSSILLLLMTFLQSTDFLYLYTY